MCGIIACIGKNTTKHILEGLRQLQNRGYDSAGLSLIYNNTWAGKKFASTNEKDSIELLEEYTYPESINGIGHTRWATHGCKNDINSHPHMSSDGTIMVVHNGIIENYKELKKKLIDSGYVFVSETDTEVISNLISYYYKIYNNVEEAINKSINELNGTWGLCIQCIDEPNTIYCTRRGSPLLIGICETFAIIASEQSGFCNKLNNYLEIESDDICMVSIINNNIDVKKKKIYKTHIVQKNYVKELNERYWTLKEIKEQTDIVNRITNNGSRIINNEIIFGGLIKYKNEIKKCDNIILLGCGTSYYACCIGCNYLKTLTNLNTIQVFDGANFTKEDIPRRGKCVFIFVSQSGETKDLQICSEILNDYIKIGIINNVDSTIARMVDCGCYMNLGREVGVASTKSFTGQVLTLSLLSLWFVQLHKGKTHQHKNIINDLKKLPIQIEEIINNYQYNHNRLNIINNNCFILGKHNDEHIAKEAALKMKEITYIHAEGYSSSALKHGPFALLNKDFPVILINSDDKYKTKNNNIYQEIKSRNSNIITITNNIERGINDIYVGTNKTYQCILNIIPLQLLCYNISINMNINPDKPRNLAKVVSVE